MTVSMEKADISKAYQVLLLISDLAPSERKVGGILLKHFNRKSGRCDPSINRIADFAGLDRSTVINAIKSLVARGLFQKIVHGGRNQAAAAGFHHRPFEHVEELDLVAVPGIGRERLGEAAGVLLAGMKRGLGHLQRRQNPLGQERA